MLTQQIQQECKILDSACAVRSLYDFLNWHKYTFSCYFTVALALKHYT